MTPWEVVKEALARHRPPRTQKWLADKLGLEIQVINNWKDRGVPSKRYREIAAILDLTVDQLEGIAPLPWEEQEQATAEQPGLPVEVVQVADELGSLPAPQREWALNIVREVISAARGTIAISAEATQVKRSSAVEERQAPANRVKKQARR